VYGAHTTKSDTFSSVVLSSHESSAKFVVSFFGATFPAIAISEVQSLAYGFANPGLSLANC